MGLRARGGAESRPKSAPRVLHRPPYPRGTGVGVRRRRLLYFPLQQRYLLAAYQTENPGITRLCAMYVAISVATAD